MSRTALFVIDIQIDMAQDPKTEIPHARRIREAGAEILNRARSAIDNARTNNREPNLEIVIVQHEEKPADGPLVRGSEPWKLIFDPRQSDDAERVVSKSVQNTFESNPQLASELKKRNVNTIVACGIQSECCVKSTCKGALTAGFKVILLRGAHSTYNGKNQPAGEIEKVIEEELAAEGTQILQWEMWKP